MKRKTLRLILLKISSFPNLLSIKSIVLSFMALIVCGNIELSAQRLSRDLNVDLLVNQVGYVPEAAKRIVTKGKRNDKFEIINLETQKVDFTGVFQPGAGDLGEYSTGDFSSLTREGSYYVKSDTLRSFPFAISGSVYQPVINLIVKYFSMQRCGSSTTGYLSPCHLDDGV
ncbi:MAG: cellulase N-terminal Ig-like domain-containing protein, partial [Bacteroidota bacterium]